MPTNLLIIELEILHKLISKSKERFYIGIISQTKQSFYSQESNKKFNRLIMKQAKVFRRIISRSKHKLSLANLKNHPKDISTFNSRTKQHFQRYYAREIFDLSNLQDYHNTRIIKFSHIFFDLNATLVEKNRKIEIEHKKNEREMI